MTAPAPSPASIGPPERLHEAAYGTLDVRVRLRSADAAALELIDRSYASLRVEPAPHQPTVELLHGPAGYVVTAPHGQARAWSTAEGAALDLMERLVGGLVSGLHRRGLFAIHAGSVALGRRALILAGPSSAGKTTLTLALAAAGLEVLSDELAIVDPTRGEVHPYRRRIHVRPGTVELVPTLRHLRQRPREQLGGGIAWAVSHEEIGASSDDARPRALTAVLVLEPPDTAAADPRIRPMPRGVCAVELLRGTWAASVDFGGALAAVGAAIAGARCASLRAARPMTTAAAVRAWLEETDGGG